MTELSFETSVCTYQPRRCYTVDEDSSNSLPWSESLKISILFSVSRFIRTFILFCPSFLRVVLYFCILCSSLLFSLLSFMYFYISLSLSFYTKLHCELSNGKWTADHENGIGNVRREQWWLVWKTSPAIRGWKTVYNLSIEVQPVFALHFKFKYE